MKKIFLIIGMFSVIMSASQANEWNMVTSDLVGYNFYSNKTFLGENFK